MTKTANAEKEHQLRLNAMLVLCDSAKCSPDSQDAQDPESFYLRLRKYGHNFSRAEVKRTLERYRNAPHVHSISTDHSLGKPCALGVKHTGCCPGECS